MKLITFAVPCRDGHESLSRCVQSLLLAGEDCEVIIVDDGSADELTPKVADGWASRIPECVRVIHQERLGHGGAVNTALAHACGLYFKLIEPTDWIDERAVKSLLMVLRRFRGLVALDMLVCNAVYDYGQTKRAKRVEYRWQFRRGEVFSWKDARRLSASNPLMAHTVIYRTQMLRDIGLELPQGLSYTDSIFSSVPLPACKRLYYLDIDLQHCLVESRDLSICGDEYVARVGDQVAVTRFLIDSLAGADIQMPKRLRDYLVSYLTLMMAMSSVSLMLCDHPGRELEYREIWTYLKERDLRLYRRVHRSFLMSGRNFGGIFGRRAPQLTHPLVETISRYH